MNMIAKSNRPAAGVAEPASGWKNWDDMVTSFFRSLPGVRTDWGFNSPGLEVEVGEKEVIVTVPFAGAKSSDFQVEIVGDCLTVNAKRETSCCKDAHGCMTKQERTSCSCSESVTLPVKVLGQVAQAAYTDGVLTIKIPRVEEDCPCSHTIEIQ